MSKTIYIVIGVVAVTLLLVVFGFKSSPLGGINHNVIEKFTEGIMIGSREIAACIKVQDSDRGGWSYVTFLNGVETVTGGSASGLAAGDWYIPSACDSAAVVDGN